MDITEPHVGLYTLPPNPPLRTFTVLTPEGTHTYEAHGVTTKHGTLSFIQFIGETVWTTKGYAPGEWSQYHSVPPSRAAMETYMEELDRFHAEHAMVKHRVQEALQRETTEVANRVRSGRERMHH